MTLEWGEEDEITVMAFSFLLKSGFRSMQVDDIAKKIIWSDDEFILSILGGLDERALKLNKKYIADFMSEEYTNRSRMAVKKREELMHKEFLSSLPENMYDWISSPFVDGTQKLEMDGFIRDLILDEKMSKEAS